MSANAFLGPRGTCSLATRDCLAWLAVPRPPPFSPRTAGKPGEVWGYATTSVKACPEFGLGEPERMVWLDATTLALTDVGATAYAPASLEDPTTGRAGYAVWKTNIARTPN
ncbi:MAG: hypothetical protein WCP31_11900 [Chloroflexales bacterium]